MIVHFFKNATELKLVDSPLLDVLEECSIPRSGGYQIDVSKVRVPLIFLNLRSFQFAAFGRLLKAFWSFFTPILHVSL